MKSVLKAMAIMVLTAVFAVGCSKPDYPYNGEGSGVYNGHEYVDLGLPSGTLWATCNVGAKAPRDYGDYFAWGETSAKTNYYLGTYKYNYCNDDGCGLTKYCNDPYRGYNDFTDNLTVLQPEDDAATANWGGGWCMPTVDQWEELKDNTVTAWIVTNEVRGRLFTASNGNSLFLPAAGQWAGADGPDYIDEGGYYWSKMLYPINPNYALHFCINQYRYDMSEWGHDREEGQSVRPVCSALQNQQK
jgi:hypothetical protein